VVLVHLGGLRARGSNDLTVRRKIDGVVREVGREMAQVCTRMADARNEPPLSEQ
jgi:hypothetical protein